METILGHIVDFVSANAAWAPYLAFVFAFGETLAFLSIVIPSTAILVAVGGLVATGSLQLFPIWLGASLGALCGSTFSWWLGLRYGPAMLNVWPLNKDPDAVEPQQARPSRNGGRGRSSSATSSGRCARSSSSPPASRRCGRCGSRASTSPAR